MINSQRYMFSRVRLRRLNLRQNPSTGSPSLAEAMEHSLSGEVRLHAGTYALRGPEDDTECVSTRLADQNKCPCVCAPQSSVLESQ